VIFGFKAGALLPIANLTRDLPLARSRHHATNAVHRTASPHVLFLFVSNRLSHVGECLLIGSALLLRLAHGAR
jgi:hypothetical protein